MKARRFLGAALLVLVICLGWSLHLHALAGEDRRKAAIIRAQAAAAQAQRERWAQRLRAAGATATSAPPKAGRPSPGGKTNWLERLQSDPGVQNRFIAYEKSGLGMKYGRLFKQLGLNAEQIARCEDNLSKRDELYMDLDEAMRAQGVSGGPAAAKLYEQMLSGNTADQVALLGADGVQKLSDYDKVFPAMAMINGMAGAATLAGSPLTPEQLQQLSAATQSAAASNPNEIDWNAVDAKAARLLTPEQLNLLQNGDFIGPLGYGSRFQNRLNNLISQADRTDQAATGGR